MGVAQARSCSSRTIRPHGHQRPDALRWAAGGAAASRAVAAPATDSAASSLAIAASRPGGRSRRARPRDRGFALATSAAARRRARRRSAATADAAATRVDRRSHGREGAESARERGAGARQRQVRRSTVASR